MTTQGYMRIIPGYSKQAVCWWYVREFPDGFVFCRGGRVGSTAEALKLLERCSMAAKYERAEFLNRPMTFLNQDGADIDFGPYGMYAGC